MTNEFDNDAYNLHITKYFNRNMEDVINDTKQFELGKIENFDSSYLVESFSSPCNDSSFNPILCKKHISNNIAKISKYTEVQENKTINNQELLHLLAKKKKPSITDARIKDTRELLLIQNTVFIVCSLVVSSFLIITITIL